MDEEIRPAAAVQSLSQWPASLCTLALASASKTAIATALTLALAEAAMRGFTQLLLCRACLSGLHTHIFGMYM